METKHIKYRFSPSSSAGRLALVFSLISAALIGVIYWPVFAKIAKTESPDLTLVRMAWVYGVLIASLVLFGLFSLWIGHRSMVFPALFCLPVCGYYVIEKIGVLQYLLFNGDGGILAVYGNNAEYFSGRNLAWVIGTAAAALIALVAVLSVVCNGGKARGFARLMLVLTAVFRVMFAVYDVRTNYQAAFDKGGITGADYTNAILLHAAAIVFFFNLAMLAIELHPVTEEQPQPAPQPMQPAPVVPQPEQPQPEPQPIQPQVEQPQVEQPQAEQPLPEQSQTEQPQTEQPEQPQPPEGE